MSHTRKPTFSFVILTYNGERTIDRLLAQLTNLTDKYNKEIIIIDSQSTDRTLQIVNKYKTLLPLKIIQIKTKDFNHGETRNLAVREVRGRFICYFSQDVIPLNKSFLTILFRDFELDKKTVVIFGKQVPSNNMPIIQQIELMCRFEKLDKFVDNKSYLIQNKKKPFLPYERKNLLLWYYLSDAFACYRRSFLLKNPFPRTNYGEDILMGKEIIEKGYTKIYDNHCVATHIQKMGLIDYYKRQTNSFQIRVHELKVIENINFFCKFKKIIFMKSSPIKKICSLVELALYYGIKLLAFLSIELIR